MYSLAVSRQKQFWAVLPKTTGCSRQGAKFAAFDIHLDAVGGSDSRVGNELVERGDLDGQVASRLQLAHGTRGFAGKRCCSLPVGNCQLQDLHVSDAIQF